MPRSDAQRHPLTFSEKTWAIFLLVLIIAISAIGILGVIDEMM
jgi:hypothetical protein